MGSQPFDSGEDWQTPREDEVYDDRFHGKRAEPTDARVEFRSGVGNANRPSHDDATGLCRTKQAIRDDPDSNADFV